jgi:hypothetical protein
MVYFFNISKSNPIKLYNLAHVFIKIQSYEHGGLIIKQLELKPLKP